MLPPSFAPERLATVSLPKTTSTAIRPTESCLTSKSRRSPRDLRRVVGCRKRLLIAAPVGKLYCSTVRVASNKLLLILAFFSLMAAFCSPVAARTWRTRYHVNGAQRIDERVATHSEGRAGFTYYLQNDLYNRRRRRRARRHGRRGVHLRRRRPADHRRRRERRDVQSIGRGLQRGVDLADVNPFVAVLLGGSPCSPCAGDTGGRTARCRMALQMAATCRRSSIAC